MVSTGYSVLVADVLAVTDLTVTLVMQQGPRKGETLPLPIAAFEEPEFVDRGDDEVVVADWFINLHRLR